jgi:hypothetical protein
MWARATAGIFPGFFLSAALVGLVTWLLPGNWEAAIVGGLIAFFPVWIGVIAASFQFSNGRHAWAWLSALALIAMGILWGLQWLAWVQ